MWHSVVFILILSLADNNEASYPAQVVLYDQPDYKGKSVELNSTFTECLNFPPEMAGQVGSFQLKNDCVHFYEDLECGGRHSLIRNSSETVPSPLRRISAMKSCVIWLP